MDEKGKARSQRMGERSSVVRESRGFNSEDRGFDPLPGGKWTKKAKPGHKEWGNVAQWLESREFNSEDPGFDPLAGKNGRKKPGQAAETRRERSSVVSRESGTQFRRPWVRSPSGAWVSNSCSVPPSQLLCKHVCASTPFVCTAHTHMCAHVTVPISICRKRVGLTAGGIETRKYCTQGGGRGGGGGGGRGNAVLWLHARFPRRQAAQISRVVHWDKKRI